MGENDDIEIKWKLYIYVYIIVDIYGMCYENTKVGQYFERIYLVGPTLSHTVWKWSFSLENHIYSALCDIVYKS